MTIVIPDSTFSAGRQVNRPDPQGLQVAEEFDITEQQVYTQSNPKLNHDNVTLKHRLHIKKYRKAETRPLGHNPLASTRAMLDKL